MRHRSVAPQIKIPPDALGIQTSLQSSSNQQVQAMFPLRSPHDFSDLGHEDIHGGNGLFVWAEFHVEGLDFFRVVGEDGGFLVDGFAEVNISVGRSIPQTTLSSKVAAPELTASWRTEMAWVYVRPCRWRSCNGEVAVRSAWQIFDA